MLAGFRYEMSLLMQDKNIKFLLRTDHEIFFYIFHEIFPTTYHLVRADLLHAIKNKNYRTVLMNNTQSIDADCIKNSNRQVQLKLIKTLGGSHDLFKKIARYVSADSVLMNFASVCTTETVQRHVGLKEHAPAYFSHFCQQVGQMDELNGYQRIVLMTVNVEECSGDPVSGLMSQRVLTVENHYSLFMLHALAALPAKIGGFPDIYLLAFPPDRQATIMLHENMQYATTRKIHRFLTRIGFAERFIFACEADTLLGKSDNNDLLVTMGASMGDCMFALGAVKALRKAVSRNIIFQTHKMYTPLARRNPYIGNVTALEDRKDNALMFYRLREMSASVFFCDYVHVVSKTHQIEACVKAVGLQPAPENFDMEIALEDDECARVDKFMARHRLGEKNVVLLHANNGDPNRSWSGENWNALAEHFIRTGWRVVAIGSTNNKHAETQVHAFNHPAVINAVDRFSVFETIALMRKCQLMVATDSGPVALAGASDIAIVALYTIVPGKRRIAYRHGKLGWNALCIDLKCRYGHCIELAADAQFCKNVLNTTIQIKRLNKWCPLGDTDGDATRYSCIKNYAADSLFKEISQFIASENYIRQANDET